MNTSGKETSPHPPQHVSMGKDEIFQFPDGIWITCQEPLLDRHGRVWSDIRAHRADETFGRGQINLLDVRTRDALADSCKAVDGVVSWRPRFLCVADSLPEYLKKQHEQAGEDIWAQALTADEFLSQEETELPATVRDMVMPGAITLISAHRGSGKTMVALYLGIALATGGVFRGERLTKHNVFAIDRDNPPALVRSRMRALGARGVTTLRVLTRDKAPALTERDRAKWEQFPVEDYDVILIDSISAFTEGVSEREGKETQEWLSILKDLALRGPAIIGLANTNKAGVNIRGRGEITNAVDIVYECRNITGWLPTKGGDWVAELPERGEHTWQESASQQRNQLGTLHIAFIATKFRFGAWPEPFVLEIDTRTTPWSLRDITVQIATAGAQAAADGRAEERRRLENAALALVRHIHEQHPTPVLKSAAETFLRSQGLAVRQARGLLEDGFNADQHPTIGLWCLREIPGSKGRAVGVYLPEHSAPRAGCENKSVKNNSVPNPPRKNSPWVPPLSDTRIPSGVENADDGGISIDADFTNSDFRHQPISPRQKSPLRAHAENLAQNEVLDFRHTPHIPTATGCPQCGCPELMHCVTYRKCPVCTWKEDV